MMDKLKLCPSCIEKIGLHKVEGAGRDVSLQLYDIVADVVEDVLANMEA